MKNFFDTIDFAGSTELIDHISWKDAAIIANAKLNKEIEKWPVVLGTPDESWAEVGDSFDTHTARLAFITEIKPEDSVRSERSSSKECEHEPWTRDDSCVDSMKAADWQCSKCGKKLKATWSAAE